MKGGSAVLHDGRCVFPPHAAMADTPSLRAHVESTTRAAGPFLFYAGCWWGLHGVACRTPGGLQGTAMAGPRRGDACLSAPGHFACFAPSREREAPRRRANWKSNAGLDRDEDARKGRRGTAPPWPDGGAG